jgi:hypothetical protein
LNLTYKQKSAVTHFILENDQALKVGEVAKKLRISVDSLKDRVNQVKKKVIARFPLAADPAELLAVKRKKEKKQELTSDLAYDGFFRKSTALEWAPIFRLDPNDLTKRTRLAPPSEKGQKRILSAQEKSQKLARHPSAARDRECDLSLAKRP